MTTTPDPGDRRSALIPGEGITLAAFIGNGLDDALKTRLSRPGPYAYLDPVEWTYAPAPHAGALFGDIGVITGRRCRVTLSLARTTRTLAIVGCDVRTLTGFRRPRPIGPLVVTVRQDRPVSARFTESDRPARLTLAECPNLPAFEAMAEFLIGHLDRILVPRPPRARATRVRRTS